MNPQGFKLGRIAGSGPRPPDDLVVHAEVARHGGVYVPLAADPRVEASYQVDVTPPIPQQPGPRPIVMDEAVLAAVSRAGSVQPEMETNGIVQGSPSRAIRSLAPPVSTVPMTSPLVEKMPAPPAATDPAEKPSGTETTTAAIEDTENPGFYDVTKPTCSLNLVCYRSGAKGCDLLQIQCVLRSMFPGDASFDTVLEANPHLVHTDDRFFREVRRLYTTQMCGFFRRYFSLKTLRAFRVLAVRWPDPR